MSTVETGTTISFHSGLCGEVYDLNLRGSRPAIPTSHMASTGGETFLPGKLVRWELEVVCAYTGQALPVAASDVAEAITITTPDSQGYSGQGFITDFAVSTPLEGRGELRLTIQGHSTLTFA